MLSASRILDVMKQQVDQNTASGAKIDYTYGQVFSVTGYEASVYLAGDRELATSAGVDPVPSDGFRVPYHLSVSASDYVAVAIDDRGHRWVTEILPSTDYRTVALNPATGALELGLGTGAPQATLTVGPTPPGVIRMLGKDLTLDTYFQVMGRPSLRTGLLLAVAGESASRVALLGDATSQSLEFGDGAGARDVNLYRGGTNLLKTDDTFLVGSGTRSNIRGVVAIPFVFSGTLPGTGTQNLNIADAAVANTIMRLPFDVQIIALTVTLTASRTAGTLTAQAFNNSASLNVGMSAAIDGTVTNNKSASVAGSSSPDILANNQFIMRVTTSGFTPTANGVTVVAWLALFAE